MDLELYFTGCLDQPAVSRRLRQHGRTTIVMQVATVATRSTRKEVPAQRVSIAWMSYLSAGRSRSGVSVFAFS